MKRMNYWGKPVALLVFLVSPVGGLEATGAVMTPTTSAPSSVATESISSREKSDFDLAQGLMGQCRAAGNSIFVYSERSTVNPIRALQPNEQVKLAEESGRAGWIAISSPISGFVQAKDLKPCSNAGGNSEEVSRPSPGRCRRVVYDGSEGVAIRERPDQNAPRISGVFFGDSVTLANPPQFRLDSEGREWVRIVAPAAGWMSNGFPSTGDINLRACI
ncbi:MULTISPECIES: SH3 domain-containing protein [unclassified Coleofasciculus]|uniref:SH3 domain-containing protein n=1 Tax=unclassified Coleofasciculus TaxID=2692782 RepID=UPI001882C9B0|nr:MULTISPECIES: SH3 domain-containing protein [unclassified Coleofasciculus]MBE9128484.1 SH3 domain-containing protein [Coleofasciculus sp. LEGE 07081]MBE9148696.1 SH3 domain-containing protein [Coleofasciculus sp. LEGE 07092]